MKTTSAQFDVSRVTRRSFFAPHDLWFDSRGDLYVSEVVRAASKNVKPLVGDYHTLQKFERLS